MRRALIAEDDAVFRRVIEFTLSRAGFIVTTAQNGKHALQCIQNQSFDCLVTDQQMPYLSGLELIAHVRSSDAHKAIPIVLCTAKGLELDSHFLTEQYDLAAVIHKPFSPKYLAETLEKCCHQSTAIQT